MEFGTICAVIVWISLLSICEALPSRNWEKATPLRSLSEVASSYDYIIVGGGTSGLTVADRLTEDSTKTVLVVEFGPIVDNDTSLVMPSKGGSGFPTQYMYNITSLPQTNLSGRTSSVPASAILGGGSAINAMFFDRGAAEDYNAWVQLGNHGWGWDDLLPYFKKAVNFTPPSRYMQQEFNVTYNLAAYGGSGPVQLSYPDFQWPGIEIEWNAWGDLGLTVEKEGANGNAVGRFWVPSSQDPKSQTRSDARLAHFERVKRRSNYHLLTLHKVTKLNFANLAAIGVTIRSRQNATVQFVAARKEVVLAAGAIHTPQLLQLSGIGPSSILTAAGVNTILDLGGVGQNFQDHPFFFMQYNFTSNVWPNPETLTDNATFAAEAYNEYWTNRTGPYSVGVGNTAAFVPLKNLTDAYKTIASTLSAQNMSIYADSSTSASVLAGFNAQKQILVNRYQSAQNAIFEFPFSASNGPVFAFLKPVSRGTIMINSTDGMTEPVVDFRALSNPIDLAVMVKLLQYARKYFNTSTIAQLGPVELLPGPTVSTDAEISAALKDTLVQPSFFHSCCSAAMMPRNKGGVVGTDLLVYGVKQLSVVDASIMPLIPGTHLCETVYAIAEKAADIIKQRS
ncbi:choline dehydrogenase [Lindgomyces ingoldianus]|uniref:Choline dehydrogenase n=1 Tax=Lindgomyces ingoldianus TaxID=673940 RepID=A0ACB6QC95_9PLEO|nr:choline dehydrogenase [Lindgomyces ingoldianus]KAF2464125.1 choline dehydrogenase [Lindgomyces ingoldianus]